MADEDDLNVEKESALPNEFAEFAPLYNSYALHLTGRDRRTIRMVIRRTWSASAGS